MKRHFLLLFIALFCVGFMYAADVPYSSWWQKGNQFYEQKQFDSAAFYYEQIASLKPQNAEVYYNLGTTYYRLNKIGLAVLNFEKTLRIKPDYKDATENLVLTQSRISNRILSSSDIFFVNWWHALTESKKATLWAIVSLVIFLFIIASLFVRRFKKNQIWVSPQLVGISGFVWVCFLLLCFVASMNAVGNNTAIIMENDAPLMMGADQKGKPQILIPEGTKVDLINEKAGWAEVRLPDGRSGWIQQNQLNKI